MKQIKTCVHIVGLERGNQPNFHVYYISEESGNYVSKFANDLLPEGNYIPQKGDKIFFLPGCDVPRFKVKQFCETYDVSLVKYVEKANIKFVGPDAIKDMLTSIHFATYSKEDIHSYLTKSFMGDPLYQGLLTAIENQTSAYVLLNWQVKDLFVKKTLGLPFNYIQIADVDSPRVRFKDEQTYQKFLNIYSTAGVYNQNEILRRINTGGVMGSEQYISIQRMLNSTDKDNLKLAMEAMANCDYEKSCVYLLLLIAEFGDKMYQSPTRNHVNFKSLLKFFEIQDIYLVTLDDIIKSLLKRKLLNKSNLDMLMPAAIQQMKENANLKYFTVEKIGLEESLLKGLEDNILDQDCDTEVVEDSEDQITPKGIPIF